MDVGVRDRLARSLTTGKADAEAIDQGISAQDAVSQPEQQNLCITTFSFAQIEAIGEMASGNDQ